LHESPKLGDSGRSRQDVGDVDNHCSTEEQANGCSRTAGLDDLSQVSDNDSKYHHGLEPNDQTDTIQKLFSGSCYWYARALRALGISQKETPIDCSVDPLGSDGIPHRPLELQHFVTKESRNGGVRTGAKPSLYVMMLFSLCYGVALRLFLLGNLRAGSSLASKMAAAFPVSLSLAVNVTWRWRHLHVTFNARHIARIVKLKLSALLTQISVRRLSGSVLCTVTETTRQYLEPPVPPGMKRLRWRCRCGKSINDDYIELKPDLSDSLAGEEYSRPATYSTSEPTSIRYHEPGLGLAREPSGDLVEAGGNSSSKQQGQGSNHLPTLPALEICSDESARR
jgi:hypothetical protein